MEDIERIIKAKNRVFQASISFGKNNPISLHTEDNHIYRVTGPMQIEDIINCGYVRPRLGKAKGGHTGEVFWTQGSDKLFYYDKRPVLETSIDILKDDGQIGSISLDDLTGVWMFDEEQNKYVNNIQVIRNAYNQAHTLQEQINQLKEIISAYDSELEVLLTNMEPYMQSASINQEISRIITKNNEINSSQINDINDYKKNIEMKKLLINYLEQLNNSLNNNLDNKEQDYAPITK